MGKKILWFVIAIALLLLFGWLLPMRSVSEEKATGFKGPTGDPYVNGPQESPPY